MCVVVFNWQTESDSPLTLAANRDEFFARPAAPLHWWLGDEILAGRDLKGGGTWMGATRSGRFALLTNLRDPQLRKTDAPSRGTIVNAFLDGAMSAPRFLDDLAARSSRFEGFNVVCATLGGRTNGARELWFLNSHEVKPRRLQDGVYALSNASLNTPWPKIERIKTSFSRALRQPDFDARVQSIDALLLDATRAADEALPATGVPREWERALSSIFIRHCDAAGNIIYGTRVSTQFHVVGDTIAMREVTHLPDHPSRSQIEFKFTITK